MNLELFPIKIFLRNKKTPSKPSNKNILIFSRNASKWLPSQSFPMNFLGAPRFGIQSLVQGAPGAVNVLTCWDGAVVFQLFGQKYWRCTVYKKVNRCTYAYFSMKWTVLIRSFAIFGKINIILEFQFQITTFLKSTRENVWSVPESSFTIWIFASFVQHTPSFEVTAKGKKTRMFVIEGRKDGTT